MRDQQEKMSFKFGRSCNPLTEMHCTTTRHTLAEMNAMDSSSSFPLSISFEEIPTLSVALVGASNMSKVDTLDIKGSNKNRRHISIGLPLTSAVSSFKDCTMLSHNRNMLPESIELDISLQQRCEDGKDMFDRGYVLKISLSEVMVSVANDVVQSSTSNCSAGAITTEIRVADMQQQQQFFKSCSDQNGRGSKGTFGLLEDYRDINYE